MLLFDVRWFCESMIEMEIRQDESFWRGLKLRRSNGIVNESVWQDLWLVLRKL